MQQEKDCSTCKFKDQAADPNDRHTRCGNCLMLTRKGREYFPSWEEDDDYSEEYDGAPTIHYI